MSGPGISSISSEGVRLLLRNVRLREDILIDEINLETDALRVDLGGLAGDRGEIAVGGEDCLVRIMVTEPNINACLAGNLTDHGSLRNVKIALLSGRARITGHFVKIITLPFSLEATPLIENGVRVTWECERARLGVGVPAALLEVLEKVLNEKLSLDLSSLPIPVWLDSLKCEPGRFTLLGKARVEWPIAPRHPAASPFGPRDARPLASLAPATAIAAQNEILTES